MRLPVAAGRVRRLVKEFEASSRRGHVLAVGGAIDLAAVLRRQLFRGGVDPAAVRLGEPEGADAYIHVLAGDATPDDEAQLRRARRARVPAIAVVVGGEPDEVPYVLATDVVCVAEGKAFPLDEIARALAARLGERGAPLAGRIPLLRDAVCDGLVSMFARRNALIGTAVWIRRADFPALTFNELRLVLRLAQAHGVPSGRERAPELAATIGAGVGLRAVAGELLGLLPVAGWIVKGGIAFAGTRALGEAARLRFELPPTQPRGAGVRAAL